MRNQLCSVGPNADTSYLRRGLVAVHKASMHSGEYPRVKISLVINRSVKYCRLNGIERQTSTR